MMFAVSFAAAVLLGLANLAGIIFYVRQIQPGMKALKLLMLVLLGFFKLGINGLILYYMLAVARLDPWGLVAGLGVPVAVYTVYQFNLKREH